MFPKGFQVFFFSFALQIEPVILWHGFSFVTLDSQAGLRDYTPGEGRRGGGGGWLFNDVLYREVPPLGLNPYTFIVKGARSVCLGLEPLRINFNVTQFNAPVLLLN